MKKAILISCFQWYKGRLEYVEQYLQKRGYEVQMWMSDFRHFEKERVEPIAGCYYIHVYSYKENISIARMFSHYDFANQVYKVLCQEKPDIVVANIPPNSVARICGKYKRKYLSTKLVFDIIDMWPESYTASKILEFPFKFWADLRDKNLKYADYIFTECELYQSYLPDVPKGKMSTLHLFRSEQTFAEIPSWSGNEVEIGYLGSINSLIDIPLIESLIGKIAKSLEVTFHIVGGGKNVQNFVDALNRAGAKVKNHGVIFDKDQLHSIIGRCHFVINMMKPSVCVGLTIKSMDYFQLGVPMFNTIKGDTADIIQKYRCGYNVEDVYLCSESVRLLNDSEYLRMRKNVQNAFTELLTKKVFIQNLKHGLDKLFEQ